MKRVYLILGVLWGGLASASPEALDTVRTTIGEWAAAEKAISREALDWASDAVLMKDLIAVAEKRVELLQATVAESEQSVSAADAERKTLLEQREATAVKAQAIEGFLDEMEAKLRDLKPRLPEPLRAELEPLYRRLPRGAQAAKPGMGQRMQSVVSLLTKIQQFDGKISVSESIRPLPGSDTEASFRTLWIGLGQAYYLAPDDAGYGVAGEAGWEWHSQPELASRVRETIALVDGTRAEPKLVDLPVDVKEGAAK